MRKGPTLYKRGFPTVVMQREYPLVANPKAGEKGQPPELMYYRRIATSDVKRQEGMYSQKAKKKVTFGSERIENRANRRFSTGN